MPEKQGNIAMNDSPPSKSNLFRTPLNLNQQIFWIILPWVIAPLLMLGITISHNQPRGESRANFTRLQPANTGSQTMLFTVIFLAIGTVSCGLAILMVKRLAEDLHHLDREISRAAAGNFAPVTPSHDVGVLQSFYVQELDRLTKSSEQLIGNFQKSVLRQQASTNQISLFTDLLALLQSNSSPPVIYGKAVQTVKKILKADRVFIYRFAPNWNGTIEVQAVSPNFSQLLSAQVTGAFFTKSMMEVDQYRNGRILVVHDVSASGFQPERLAAYEQAQTKSNIAAPIMLRNHLVGLLCVQQCVQPRYWQKWEVDLCSNIASFLGLILNQADVSTGSTLTEQQSVQPLHMLSKISTQLLDLPDPQLFWVMLMDEIRTVLKLDRAIFFQLDDQFVGEIIVESVDPTIKAIKGEKIIDTCLQTNRGCGYETGRISALSDIYTSDLTECHLQMMERLEIRANIVAPVIIDNSLHGLLIGHMSRAARPWQQAEIDLLAQIARQISLVLTQSSLLKQLQWQKEIQSIQAEQQQAAKEQLQRQLFDVINKAEL
jgi:methyl-accepting chemotaxis protein PixJ